MEPITLTKIGLYNETYFSVRLSISRVLSSLVIYLGLWLPKGSSSFYKMPTAGTYCKHISLQRTGFTLELCRHSPM